MSMKESRICLTENRESVPETDDLLERKCCGCIVTTSHIISQKIPKSIETKESKDDKVDVMDETR